MRPIGTSLLKDEKTSGSNSSYTTQMVRSVFEITGHVCASCSQAIRTILSQHPMIQPESIMVEILGRVELIHNSQLSPETIPAIVKTLGYGLALKESNKIILRSKDSNLGGLNSSLSGCLMGSDFLPSALNLAGTCRSLGKNLIDYSKDFDGLVDPVVDQAMSVELMIAGLTCGFTANTVEEHLSKMDGVISASVALATSRAKIEYDPAQVGIRDLVATIKRFGYGVDLCAEDTLPKDNLTAELKTARLNLLISLGFAIPTLVVELISAVAVGLDHPLKKISNDAFLIEGLTLRIFFDLILSTLSLIFLGWPFIRGTYRGLRYARFLSVDGMISFATILAYSAAVGMFAYDLVIPLNHISPTDPPTIPNPRFYLTPLFLTTVYMGRYLEVQLKRKSFKFLDRLLGLRPTTAIVITRSQDSKGRVVITEVEMEVELLKVNDIVKVNAGERFPCDGEIVMGASSIDESILAAESTPCIRGLGEEVVGGSLNLTTMLWVKVRRIRTKSTLVQIVELVQAAQSIRSKLQDKVNLTCSKFPVWHILFTLVVMLGWISAGAAGLIPDSWLLQGYPYPFLAAVVGASVLVVTGPCSLGLAIPVPVMASCSLGARHGVLVTGGDTTLRLGSRVDVVVFDKTGTLTRGCPVVTDVRLDVAKGEESWRSDVAVWELLLCVETPSQHPLAFAVKTHAQTVLSISNPEAATQQGLILTEFSEHQGKGVRGVVDFGRNIILPGGFAPASKFLVALGTRAWLSENNISLDGEFASNLDDFTAKWSKRGKSTMFIGIQSTTPGSRGCVAGALAAADALRPESRSLVSELRSRNIEVWMLTGDNTHAANECARLLGIDNVIPEVLPHQKADRVRWLQTRDHIPLPDASWCQKQPRYVVAMVGEGINDALALNQADVGIALSGGHDLAINAADVILLRSKLTDIVTFLSLSQSTARIIDQNLFGISIYNLLALPISAGILLPFTGFTLSMPLAGLLSILSSLVILINSLRSMYQFSPPNIAHNSKFTPVQFTSPA